VASSVALEKTPLGSLWSVGTRDGRMSPIMGVAADWSGLIQVGLALTSSGVGVGMVGIGISEG
jgi:hypothetical protein